MFVLQHLKPCNTVFLREIFFIKHFKIRYALQHLKFYIRRCLTCILRELQKPPREIQTITPWLVDVELLCFLGAKNFRECVVFRARSDSLGGK